MDNKKIGKCTNTANALRKAYEAAPEKMRELLKNGPYPLTENKKTD